MIDPRPRPVFRVLARALSHGPARRALAVAAGVAMLVLGATPALSQVSRPRDEQACLAALKDAKGREQEGALQAAKVLLRSCAQNPCSTFVRQQCANRYNKLDIDTPTVVILVSDATGAARADVQVRVDGEPFVTQIDGRALQIDPGMHDFSFIADGRVFATQKIMIVQGQRNRFITAVIGKGGRGTVEPDDSAGMADNRAAPSGRSAHSKTTAAAGKATAEAETETEASSEAEAPPAGETPPAVKRPHARLPWILTGVGVAALSAGTVLTLWGRSDNNKLVQCSPTCAPTTLSHIRHVYQAADVSIGVGVAALGAAYWIYAITQGLAGESHGSESALRLDVAPTNSGGFASISGAF